MRRLMEDSRNSREFARVVATHPVSEIRILLKIVCAFYSRLHCLADAARDREAWRRLGELLPEAYHAELHSTCSPSNMDRAALLGAAEKKSTALLDVLLQITRVTGAPMRRTIAAPAKKFI